VAEVGIKRAKWSTEQPTCGPPARRCHATNLGEAADSSSAPMQHSRQVSPGTDLLEGRPATYWVGRPPSEPFWPLAWPTTSPPVVEPMTLVKFELLENIHGF
jgi:hypothetical protein